MPMSTEFTDLYVEVLQHYAVQMHALDEGKFAEYADTFTEDGEFRHTPGRPAARGRQNIVEELHDFHRRFENDPVQRRHWFDMVAVYPETDGTVRTTYYALVVTTRPEQRPVLAPSCVVRDVLVRRDGVLLNRSRIVDHDKAR
jgi:actinorhodin biosynthesis protein ActVIA